MNLGLALHRHGRLVEALACYRRAQLLRPALIDAHIAEAMALLALGDFPAGWHKYEWRLLGPKAMARPLPRPPWRGEPLTGRTLLLRAEQGLGDTLQFIRYARLVKARGAARVVVECPPELVRLVRSAPGVDEVVATGARLPAFDDHVLLMSLPHRFGTTLATIPADGPYLSPPPDLVARWAPMTRDGVGLKVGLVWAGSPRPDDAAARATDRRRSLTLDQLAPVLAVAGCTFFSLQMGEAAVQLESSDCRPINVMDGVADLADTAALMAGLDLVITVDTAMVHLAGALGKPVWVLSRFDGCWRWLQQREDSPWYPTLRLFRQPRPGDWHSVVQRVAAALAALAARSGPPGPNLATSRIRAGSRGLNPLAAALAHHRAGRLPEAEADYRALLTAHPHHADALHLLGVVAHQRGDNHTALELIGHAIAIEERAPDFHTNLGEVYRVSGQARAAIHQFRRALALRPNLGGVHNNLGLALQELGRLPEAIAEFQQALALEPHHAEAHNNLGNTLWQHGAWDEAFSHYQRALVLKPDYAEAHMNRANLLKDQGRLRAALDGYQQALALKPDLAQAHWNQALARLALGDFARGWAGFEGRWDAGVVEPRGLPQPLWAGDSLAGRTILLHAEQGYGDTLQFIRYAPLIKALGAKVMVECPPALVRLLAAAEGVDRVVARGEPLPAFDCQLPLLSLPHRLGTTLATIPAQVPYLAADPGLVARGAARLPRGPSLRVGLVWAGEPRPEQPGAWAIDRRRSLMLEQLAPVLAVGGIDFVSLQKGAAARQPVPEGGTLIDLMDAVEDFADTAALVAGLDLVISVDTAVVHLAGALGKPVWVLSRFDACWRWMLERSDSPWYPTLRLFRQPRPGDWAAVITDVVRALEQVRALVPVVTIGMISAGSDAPCR